MKTTRGLIIKKEFLDLIFSAAKTWEIRGTRTKVEGRIGLIESGSGKVMGDAELVECVGPLSLAELKRNARKAGTIPSKIDELPYEKTYAWVMKNARRSRKPKSYIHPRGAIIWVKL